MSTISAVLVAIDFHQNLDFQDECEEFVQLVSSAGIKVTAQIYCKRQRPDPAYYIGSGKADEIAAMALASDAPYVIFNHDLSAVQQRNLEKRIQKTVLDRTALILDIFAQRARSHEGQLQVELAQLKHLSTRLVGGWIGLRGPGEKQLETDRRLITDRVKILQRKLQQLQRQRNTQRHARIRRDFFMVSLVGYTNAGKSTLFNRFTKAGVYAADQLFATLDTISRRMYLEGLGQVVVSDTVGFIRDLPHQLINAFRATLTETIEADLLLHVVDASSVMRNQQIEQVNSVLSEIGAEHIPQIQVWNKIDKTFLRDHIGNENINPDLNQQQPLIYRNEYGKIDRVFISAQEGVGLAELRQAIIEYGSDLRNNRFQNLL